MSTRRAISERPRTPRIEGGWRPRGVPLATIGLALFAASCSRDGDGGTPAEIDPTAAAEIVRQAQIAEVRASFPDRANAVCNRYGTLDGPHAEPCVEAAVALYDYVIERVLASPPEWESAVLATLTPCVREAFRHAQSEVKGMTEPELLVQGLRKAPRCIDDRYAVVTKYFADHETRGADGAS